MRRIAVLAFSLTLTLALAACGGGGGGAAAGGEDETKVKEAVAFLSTSEGTPGVFVKGRDIVVNYATRPPTFADTTRKAALEASKATGGKSVKLYVVDGATVATAVPAAGQFYCSISADDSRMSGNNC
jgi:hypothetical protein